MKVRKAFFRLKNGSVTSFYVAADSLLPYPREGFVGPAWSIEGVAHIFAFDALSHYGFGKVEEYVPAGGGE